MYFLFPLLEKWPVGRCGLCQTGANRLYLSLMVEVQTRDGYAIHQGNLSPRLTVRTILSLVEHVWDLVDRIEIGYVGPWVVAQ